MSGVILLALRVLITLAIYIFLIWALYTLWLDLRYSSQLQRMHIPALILTRLDSPELTALRFSAPQIIIGRDTSCSCHVDDITISAQHARLSYHHAQWWVEDLESTNGTYLNDEPAKMPLVIATSDQLRCGQIVFSVTIVESETSPSEANQST